jgi:hypothetical protein
VAASEPSLAEWRGLELRKTWRGQSPQQGGGVQSCGTCGGAGGLISREVGFGVAGHVVASESFSAERRCSEPRARGGAGALLSREAGSEAEGHVASRPAPCLGLMLYAGVPGLLVTDRGEVPLP